MVSIIYHEPPSEIDDIIQGARTGIFQRSLLISHSPPTLMLPMIEAFRTPRYPLLPQTTPIIRSSLLTLHPLGSLAQHPFRIARA